MQKEGMQMAKDYQAALEDLRTGKVEELVITPDEFMAFQPVFYNYEYKNQLVGAAHRGGEIHYRMKESGDRGNQD